MTKWCHMKTKHRFQHLQGSCEVLPVKPKNEQLHAKSMLKINDFYL